MGRNSKKKRHRAGKSAPNEPKREAGVGENRSDCKDEKDTTKLASATSEVVDEESNEAAEGTTEDQIEADEGAVAEPEQPNRGAIKSLEDSDQFSLFDTCEFIQQVLDKCRVAIVEGLDRSATVKILDVFRIEKTFGESTHVTVRDMEDALKNKTTSDCLRKICDDVRRLPTSYVMLKSALARTGQETLLATIENIETTYHNELRGQNHHGCDCTSDIRCPLQEPLKCPKGLLPFKSSRIKEKDDTGKTITEDHDYQIDSDEEDLAESEHSHPRAKHRSGGSDQYSPFGIQQSEWPPLVSTAVDDGSEHTSPSHPTLAGINIRNTIISTNTQIGDNNIIAGCTSDGNQRLHEEADKDKSQRCEKEEARPRSYANVTKTFTTENLNINYNISVKSDSIKTPSSDVRMNKEMEKILKKTGNFENEHYILVIGSVKPVKNLSVLGLVPWTAVLDYDPHSRTEGLFSYVDGTLEKKRSLHMKTWQDKCNFTEKSTDWIFMRGSADRPDSVLDEGFNDWKSKIQKDLRLLIRQLDVFRQGHTEYTVVVVWHEDKEICRHLKFSLLKLQDVLNPSILLVTDGNDKSTLPDFDNFDDIQTIEISTQELCNVIQRKLKHDETEDSGGFRLPTSDKTNNPEINDQDAHYLNEELEVLYLDNKTGINYEMKDLQEEEENFFRGGTLPWAWWYHLGGGHADAERDLKDEIVKLIKEDNISMCRSGCVTLYHAPGSGGTTLAQRILWDFRKEIPCAQVQHRCEQSLEGLAEKIQFLSDRTHLPVLLLIDGEEEQKVEHIQRILHCCVIILYVKRCPIKPRLRYADDFWLKPFVSKREGKSIGMKYLDQCSRLKKTEKQKQAVHNLIVGISGEKEHSIFEFGLAVHSYEYKGIYSYVKGFLQLDENKGYKLHPWQKALVMLSLAHYYGQTSVPCQFLSTRIRPKENTKVLRFDDLPTEMKELVVRDPHERRSNVVRISHYYIAKEILDQVLLWRQGKVILDKPTSPFICSDAKKALEPVVLDFIETAGEVYKNNASETVLKVLIRTIISRDNTAVGENETQAARSKRPRLSPIIEDVSTDAPYTERINVVKKLTESFPMEPQFHAHLGRMYTICRQQEEEKADRCFRKALDICEEQTKGLMEDEIPQNMKLTLMHVYHMYGNMYSTRVAKYTGRNMYDKPRRPTTTGEFETVSKELFDNTSLSCRYFNKCRAITPPGCEKSVGFIGEINVRLMFCDFINRHKCSKRKSLHDFVDKDGSNIGDFVGECFIKLDELFIDCFSTIEPEKMDPSVWNCQEWYVALFNDRIPGHMMCRNVEGTDNSRRKIVMLKMKYSDPKTLGVLDLVTSREDILVIVEEYEKIFASVDQGRETYRISKRDLDIDYREWLFAIRHHKFPKDYPTDLVLTHVQKWFDNIKTQNSRFYLFILKTLIGFGMYGTDGNTELLIQAQALKAELVKYAKYMTKPKYPREWLGPAEESIRRLCPGFRFFGQIEVRDNVTNGSTIDLKLEIMKGTICPPNDKPAVGYISLDLGPTNKIPVSIFYVPAISGMRGSKNASARVEFVIGFSIAHGYEAFNVEKLGRVNCPICMKSNEYRSCDKFIQCSGCGESVKTRRSAPSKRDTNSSH